MLFNIIPAFSRARFGVNGVNIHAAVSLAGMGYDRDLERVIMEMREAVVASVLLVKKPRAQVNWYAFSLLFVREFRQFCMYEPNIFYIRLVRFGQRGRNGLNVVPHAEEERLIALESA